MTATITQIAAQERTGDLLRQAERRRTAKQLGAPVATRLGGRVRRRVRVLLPARPRLA